MSPQALMPVINAAVALNSQQLDMSLIEQLAEGLIGRGMPHLPRDIGGTGFVQVDTTSAGGRHWDVDNALGYRLDFQFLGVTEFMDGGTASYNSPEIIGRSEAYQVYQNTETREITLALKFAAQGIEDQDEERAIEREVKLKADWCRALAYPTYVGGIMSPPPVVDVYFGKMFVRNGAAMKALVQNVQVAYCSDEAPMTPVSFLPYIAQVDITFRCIYMAGPRAHRMLGSDTILRGEF